MDHENLTPTRPIVQPGDRVLYSTPGGAIRCAMVVGITQERGFRPSFTGMLLDGDAIGRPVFAYLFEIVAVDWSIV